VLMPMARARMPVTLPHHLRARVARFSGSKAYGATAVRKARASTVELMQYATD
jgi:hypothetical protein